jgi:hypothetical protein
MQLQQLDARNQQYEQAFAQLEQEAQMQQGMVQQGGGMQMGMVPNVGTGMPPPTMTQEHLNFLDGTDEVPDTLFERMWGLFTRQNQLTNLYNETEMNRIRALVRSVTRPMGWRGDLTLEESQMTKHFVELQIHKSFKQGERRLLVSSYMETKHSEEVMAQQQQRSGFGAKIAGLFGRR